MRENIEKSIKRWLKRKVTITLGVMVAFLITGGVVYSNDGVINQEVIIKWENGKIVAEIGGQQTEIGNSWTNSGKIDVAWGNGVIIDNYMGNKGFNIINNGTIKGISGNGISNYNDIYNSKIEDITNSGIIVGTSEITIRSNSTGNGINSSGYSNSIIGNITNSGIIIGTSKIIVESRGTGNGISSYSDGYNSKIGNITNSGIIMGDSIVKNEIYAHTHGNGISSSSDTDNASSIIGNTINTSLIIGNGTVEGGGTSIFEIGNGISSYSCNESIIGNLINTGLIVGNGTVKGGTTISETGNGISSYSNGYINSNSTIGNITNKGLIVGNGIVEGGTTVSGTGNGISSYSYNKYVADKSNSTIGNITNIGLIVGNGIADGGTTVSGTGNGISSYSNGHNSEIGDIINYGVIAGSNKAIYISDGGTIKSQTNYGLLINGAGTKNVKVNVGTGGVVDIGTSEKPDNRFIINTIEKNNDYVKLENEQAINIEKINFKLNGNGNYKLSENSFKNLILNGYGTTLMASEDLSLNNSIINGGVDKTSATIKGSDSTNNLTLKENSIINGNIDLGAGDDKLSIDNTVQLNGDLLGGAGIDNLIFNPKGVSTFGGEDDNNINIFNKVEGFENINVATDVTLFESAEVTGAKNIAIQKDGNLILRIDGTEKDGEGNVVGHALSGNTGVISSEGGKLLLALNGVGEGETIDFGNNKLDSSIKGNEIGYTSGITLDTTSLLHSLTKGEGNTVIVNTVENLPTDFMPTSIDYSKLNSIYQSMRITDQVKEFDVTDDKKLSGFTSYLNDIYAGNPYSFSSELSRKSINMFSDVVMGRDLHPEVNKWAIYGGLTHIDGGTKDTYFGKGYYTYDIGSKDIDVDSKITGIYAQGEYGVNETLNLGVIFGGNQSESEINNSSKVEGDSFYLGAYAKKYLGNLRLLAGVGYQYGDYEADRVAVGYEGITTTRTFDSNYNDNTFNIYAQAKYSNKLAENLYLEPSIALDYTYVNQEGASESGVLAIETDSKDFNYTTAKFGVDLRKDIPTTTATHSLVAGAYYNRMLDGYEEENITGRFVGGSDFDILVSPSNKHEVGLRAKYEVSLNNGVTFDVKGSYTFERESYSGENKNDHKGEWIVGAGIGYRF